jgi:hypothetical protein
MSKLTKWDVEDQRFWDSTGKSIANRNLIVSVPGLLCRFSAWLYWAMIANILQRVHFANPELLKFSWGNDDQSHNNKVYRALLFALRAA